MFSNSPGQESQNVFQAAFPMDPEAVKTKVGHGNCCISGLHEQLAPARTYRHVDFRFVFNRCSLNFENECPFLMSYNGRFLNVYYYL
jgi:hypothetical protein